MYMCYPPPHKLAHTKRHSRDMTLQYLSFYCSVAPFTNPPRLDFTSAVLLGGTQEDYFRDVTYEDIQLLMPHCTDPFQDEAMYVPFVGRELDQEAQVWPDN